MRKAKQLELFARPLPEHIVLVKTNDLDLTTQTGIDACVLRMLDAPIHNSILLDFLHGRKRGDPHASEDHADLHRLMALLNSRHRNRRFNFLGDSLAARLFRNSIRTGSWLPAALHRQPQESAP